MVEVCTAIIAPHLPPDHGDPKTLVEELPAQSPHRSAPEEAVQAAGKGVVGVSRTDQRQMGPHVTGGTVLGLQSATIDVGMKHILRQQQQLRSQERQHGGASGPRSLWESNGDGGTHSFTVGGEGDGETRGEGPRKGSAGTAVRGLVEESSDEDEEDDSSWVGARTHGKRICEMRMSCPSSLPFPCHRYAHSLLIS